MHLLKRKNLPEKSMLNENAEGKGCHMQTHALIYFSFEYLLSFQSNLSKTSSYLKQQQQITWPWIAVMAVRPIWVMQKSTDPIWTSVRPCWCHLCKNHSRAAWFLSTLIILMRKYWKEHSPYWLVPSHFNLYIFIQIHILFLQSFQGYLQVCLLEWISINS